MVLWVAMNILEAHMYDKVTDFEKYFQKCLSTCKIFENRCYCMMIMHTYLYSLTVPFPPIDVQLDLKFIDGNVNITATWIISGNLTRTIYIL